MILSFEDFINENNQYKIDKDNFLEYKDKILALISTSGNTDLRKGFDFTVKNISDYDDDFVKEMIDTFFIQLNVLVSKDKYFFKDENKGYSGYKSVGDKYHLTKDLSLKDINNLIKKELAIEFPDWKFSSVVRNHTSIDTRIIYIPYNPFSEEYSKALASNTEEAFRKEQYEWTNSNKFMYNEQYIKDKKKIDSIHSQYNMDDSDAMIDYSHVNYYGRVEMNEDAIIGIYFPNNEKYLNSKKWDEEYASIQLKRKEKADKLKGKLKRGDAIYIVDKDGFIPKGEYPCVILKVPNGRGIYPTYFIRYTIDKKLDANGNIVPLPRPITFETNVSDESKLRQ